MSALALKIQKWYNNGIWTYAMVENAYKKGKITEAEFNEITRAN